MSLRIFVVSCVIVDRTIRPDVPLIFLSEERAIGHLEEQIRRHWEVQKELNEGLGECPSDWEVAQRVLAALHTDGSWGWYTLTRHSVIPCAITAPPLAHHETA